MTGSYQAWRQAADGNTVDALCLTKSLGAPPFIRTYGVIIVVGKYIVVDCLCRKRSVMLFQSEICNLCVLDWPTDSRKRRITRSFRGLRAGIFSFVTTGVEEWEQRIGESIRRS